MLKPHSLQLHTHGAGLAVGISTHDHRYGAFGDAALHKRAHFPLHYLFVRLQENHISELKLHTPLPLGINQTT